MAAIDFTKKGLNQTIFSKKAVRATIGSKSSAFRDIMKDKSVAHVMDKAGEKRVFYDALKKRALESGKGVTRNVMKKVLGDIEHSGQFSHGEMHELREHLVGGPMSSNIIREHKSASLVSGTGIQKITHAEVNMRKIYDEITAKNSEKNRGTAMNNGQKDSRNLRNFSSQDYGAVSAAGYGMDSPKKILSFSQSNNAIRQAQGRSILAKSEVGFGKSREDHFGHMEHHSGNHNGRDDIESVKSMLAKIQENPDK